MRNTNVWILVLGFALTLFAAPARAQSSGPKVTAQLATGVVKLGGVVSCVVQVEGAKQASLDDVPVVEGLRRERISGPSINEVMRSVGGRRTYSRTLSWVVTFRPERVGDFVLPPMSLAVDGKPMQTRELSLSVVEDMTGADLGYLEFLDIPERVYEGQPFSVRMQFGWDVQIDSMVNVANLILPWWNELPGTLEVESDVQGPGARLIEVQVNGRARVRATDLGQRDVREKPFRILEISRSFVATRSGQLDFPQSWLEFGQVRRRAFSEQKETYHVGVPAFAIEVRTLPEENRPPEFSGGVGRFAAQGDVNRRDIDLGESLKLTVDWTGEANLEFFELPNPSRLEAFEEFRVYGSTNERFYGDRRRVIYDLAPKNADVFEVPPLPLVVFDPELGEYTTISTAPIPIRVRAIEGVTELSEEGAGGGPAPVARDIQSAEDVDGEVQGPAGGVVGAAWIGLPLLWLAGRTTARRRGRPDAPAARRRRAARRRLARELRAASDATAQARAWNEYLGARTGEPAEAWEGRDPRAWNEEREVDLDPALVDELTEIAAALDARRWAGDGQKLDDSRLARTADALSKGGF